MIIILFQQELLALRRLLQQALNVLHGARAEPRSEFLLFLAVAALVIHADLAEPAVHVDLPAVLGTLYLHLSLHVLAELHHVLLLGHHFVSEGGPAQGRLVVLLLVDLHEVLTRLLGAPASDALGSGCHFGLYLGESVLWLRVFFFFFLRFLINLLLFGGHWPLRR